MTLTPLKAPSTLPADVADLLRRFRLTLPGLLTTDSAKARKDGSRQLTAMHYATPARSLARAVDPGTVSDVPPRGFLPDVYEIATRERLLSVARDYDGRPFKTVGCESACLAYSGHGGLSVAVQSARSRRTLARLNSPKTYGRAVLVASARELARARAAGLPLSLRLNGVDEYPWHRLAFPVSVEDAMAIRRRYGVDVATGSDLTIDQALASLNPDVIRYEYLKAPVSGRDGLNAWRAAGVDVTASLAADRRNGCRQAIAAVASGFRLAVPVDLPRGHAIPRRVIITAGLDRVTLSTVDGDKTDARHRDLSDHCAVILRGKRSRGADPAKAAGFILPRDGLETAGESVSFEW